MAHHRFRAMLASVSATIICHQCRAADRVPAGGAVGRPWSLGAFVRAPPVHLLTVSGLQVGCKAVGLGTHREMLHLLRGWHWTSSIGPSCLTMRHRQHCAHTQTPQPELTACRATPSPQCTPILSSLFYFIQIFFSFFKGYFLLNSACNPPN